MKRGVVLMSGMLKYLKKAFMLGPLREPIRAGNSLESVIVAGSLAFSVMSFTRSKHASMSTSVSVFEVVSVFEAVFKLV